MNIEDVLHIKDVFPSLSAEEMEKIIKAKNSYEVQKKPKINIMTRRPLRKQIIISIAKSNTELIINKVSLHIANINKCLRNIKLDIVTNFIHITNNKVIIIMNKPAIASDLMAIEKYIKNIDNIKLNSIKSPCLSKFKLYLKITRLPHKLEQGVLSPEIIEGILKESHLFEDIMLVLKPCIIKVSPKSDSVVVWIDI